MLKGKTKEDVLYSLVYQYISEQYNNKVWNRESSSSFLIAKGRLLGFCMAYEWQMMESVNIVQIRSKSGKIVVLELRKDMENMEEKDL